MASNIEIGQLLRSLVASKPDGDFLEIGTGTGLATSWLLDGMGQKAHLTSLDNEPNCLAIATAFLGDDDRLNLCCTDGNEWLKNNLAQFDALDGLEKKNVLGNLMYPLVDAKVTNPEHVPKITGMLIDLEVLRPQEIVEIMEM